MPLLFRKGDTRAAKAVQLILCVPSLVALAGLISRSRIHPHDSLQPWAIGFGCVFAAGFLIALLRDTNPNSPFTRLGPFKRLASLVLLVPAGWMMGYFAVWLGAPTVWANLYMEPSWTSASVTYVLPERWRRGCDYQITIQGGQLPLPMTPCVSKELHRSVQRGTLVAVEYTDGAGAFVIHDVKQPR